jgi:preprotein translocase subunit Sss1
MSQKERSRVELCREQTEYARVSSMKEKPDEDEDKGP